MLAPALFGSIGYTEVIVILFVLLLVFGTRLPEVAKSLGKALNQFKRGMREIEEEPPEEQKKDEKPPAG